MLATHNAGGIDSRHDRIVRMENGTLHEWVPGKTASGPAPGWRKAQS
jgi:hypothetical protein